MAKTPARGVNVTLSEERSGSEQNEARRLFERDSRLLILDDDRPFLTRLAKAMLSRGFSGTTAETVADAMAIVRADPPAFAIIDMRLNDGNGLDVITELKTRRPEARGIVLTGYGNISSAVIAVKLGAFDYIAKPADADEVFLALMNGDIASVGPAPQNPMSAERVRWEHIQRIFELCERNVSETARRLNMHRRTLQRILAKRAPK
jgi:two-component system response regulator RegA